MKKNMDWSVQTNYHRPGSIINPSIHLNLPESPLSVTSLGAGQGLCQDFHNRCPNWDIKNLGCPKSPIEKVNIITLTMYINN